MELQIEIGNDLEIILKSQKIRSSIFVQEQGIPAELDLDGLDDRSYHAIGYINGQAVSTARLTVTENGKALLSRVAVQKEFRGTGIASKIVSFMLLQAKKLEINVLSIFPHEYLKNFYESFGFEYIESSGSVGAHQLIKMEKTLN